MQRVRFGCSFRRHLGVRTGTRERGNQPRVCSCSVATVGGGARACPPGLTLLCRRPVSPLPACPLSSRDAGTLPTSAHCHRWGTAPKDSEPCRFWPACLCTGWALACGGGNSQVKGGRRLQYPRQCLSGGVGRARAMLQPCSESEHAPRSPQLPSLPSSCGLVTGGSVAWKTP